MCRPISQSVLARMKLAPFGSGSICVSSLPYRGISRVSRATLTSDAGLHQNRGHDKARSLLGRAARRLIFWV